MATTTASKGLIALLRLPYWLMTGGLSLLTALAITSALAEEFPVPTTFVLIFFSMAFFTSAGFALNDYFDRESDAVIKPKRPIPSGALNLKQVVTASAVLFTAGMVFSSLLKSLIFVSL